MCSLGARSALLYQSSVPLEMSTHEAGGWRAAEIISKEHSVVLILLQETCDAEEYQEEHWLRLRQSERHTAQQERETGGKGEETTVRTGGGAM